MKLDFGFPALDALVHKMGATPSAWQAHKPALDPRSEILIELEKGKEIELSEVLSSFGGLLTHKGEQVMLYIKNTRKDRYALEHALDDAPKFHIAECAALAEMRRRGRFERYVATNNHSGLFDVVSWDKSSRRTEDMQARLYVCKKCLETLNWNEFSRARGGQRNQIRDSFSIEDFFMEFSTFFHSKPRYTDKNAPKDGYAPDWISTSRRYREKMKWVCEKCHIDLSGQKRLLHCHHKNGVTSDNSNNNLLALCVLCHANQPSHGHMKASSSARLTIERLRREQGLS